MLHLATIGYEDAALSDVIATLKRDGVARVVDVRELPLSRRPGFSKSPLRQALAEAGIGYVHQKPLGTPKAGRAAAREGRKDAFRAIYERHLTTPEAQAGLSELVRLAREGRACLLCYERDPRACHRSLIVEALGQAETVEARDLFVVTPAPRAEVEADAQSPLRSY